MKRLLIIISALLLLDALLLCAQCRIDTELTDMIAEVSDIKEGLGGASSETRIIGMIDRWDSFNDGWEFMLSCGEFESVRLSLALARDQAARDKAASSAALTEAIINMEHIREKQTFGLRHIL